MSKRSSINHFFKIVDRREHLEWAEQQLQAARVQADSAPAAPIGEVGSLRIATINTCGTKSISRTVNLKKNAVEKAPTLEAFAKSEKLDAILVQELRSGSWKDKMKIKPRIFESNAIGEKHEGGRAGIIVFNQTWELSPVVFAGRDTVAVAVLKPHQFLLISIYLPPNNYPRAQRALEEVRKLVGRHQGAKIIMGGDLNSTESVEAFDAQPPGQKVYDRLREPITKLRETINVLDPITIVRNKAPIEYITRWDPSRPGKGRRLDKFYITASVLAEQDVSVWNYPYLGISDHYPVIIDIKANGQRGDATRPRPKRIPLGALSHPSLKTLILNEWDRTFPFGTKSIRSKLEIFKETIVTRVLDEWKKLRSDAKKPRKSLYQKLTRLRCGLSSMRERQLNPNNEEILAHQKALIELEENIIVRRLENVERARVANIQTAGRSTKEFFSRPAQKKRTIQGLVSDDSDNPDHERTDEWQVIAENFRKRFAKIYQEVQIDEEALGDLLAHLQWDLTQEETDLMNAPIQEDEVQKVILKLPNRKSPGPDGIPDEFYKLLADRAVPVLTRIFNKIAKDAKAPPSYNTVYISLIPKETDSFNTNKYRGISLAASDYKIMMRVWDARFSVLIARHIGDYQTGFVKGRDGRENIIAIQSTIEHLDAKGTEGATVCLDIAKAFDSVAHRALIRIAEKLQLGTKFINTIKAVYRIDKPIRNSARILINGWLTDEISVCAGTRQGCPGAPSKYLTVAELLLLSLLKDSNFKGHIVSGETQKANGFADDTAVHVSSESDFRILEKSVLLFEKATNLAIQKLKSRLIPHGPWKREVPFETGMKVVKETRYLGVPIGVERDLAPFWENLLTKIKNEIPLWKSKGVSLIDRALVIRTMLVSKMWYALSVLPPPPGWVRSVENICLEYLWGGSYNPQSDEMTKRLHKLSVSKLRLPWAKGGIDLWDLQAQAYMLKATWVLQTIFNPRKKVSRVIRAIIEEITNSGKINPFALEAEATEEHLPSATLRDIQHAWSKIFIRRDPIERLENVVVIAPDGNVRLSGLAVKIGPKKIKVSGTRDKDESFPVVSVFRANPENFSRIHPKWVTWNELTWCRNGDQFVRTDTIVERMTFERVDPDGLARAPKIVVLNRDLYEIIHETIRPPAEKIMKENKMIQLGVELKDALRVVHLGVLSSAVKGHALLLINHAVPVRGRIMKHKPEVDQQCPLCASSTETITHLYEQCRVTRSIYNSLITIFRENKGINIPEMTLVEQLNGAGKVETTEPAVVYAIARWHIWRQRNEICFQNIRAVPPMVVAHAIMIEYELSLKAQANRMRKEAAALEFRTKLQQMTDQRRDKIAERISLKKDKAKMMINKAEKRKNENGPDENIGLILLTQETEVTRGYHEWTELATAVAYKMRKKKKRIWREVAAIGRLPDH